MTEPHQKANSTRRPTPPLTYLRLLRDLTSSPINLPSSPSRSINLLFRARSHLPALQIAPNDPRLSSAAPLTPKRLSSMFSEVSHVHIHLFQSPTPPSSHLISPTFRSPPLPTTAQPPPPHFLPYLPLISRDLPSTTDAKSAQHRFFHFKTRPLPP